SPGTSAGVTPTTSASSSPAWGDSPTPSDAPTPTDWTVYANKTGQLTFSAPADWGVQNCESRDLDQGYFVAEYATDSGAACGRGGYYTAWLFGISIAGDQRSAIPPDGGNYFYAAKPDTATEVVVDGVSG